MAQHAEGITPESLRELVNEEVWLRGETGKVYLRPKQNTVLNFLRDTQEPFLEASRRWGKTTTVLNYVVEESNRRSILTRWCEPWKYQCREIVMPEMDQIQTNLPKRYLFDFKKTDSVYVSRWNQSQIYLRGVNEDRGESARGTKSHLIVADELGTWREPRYVLSEVLMPQLLTTKGKLVKTGTPPRELTHAYYEMKDQSLSLKRFIQMTIHDIEGVEWEDIERFVVELGGWDSPAVQRELLCRKVIDPNYSLVPEWKEDFVQSFEVDEYFQFYHKYDALDVGVRDLTVCLLAHYDFKQATLFIHDEVVMNGPEMTTEKLAIAIRARETERFNNMKIRKRVSDVDLLLIQDLQNLHKLYFEATDKGELEQMVNEVRIWVGNKRLVVHPRCEQTIGCLRYGIWDDNRTKFERSEKYGHFDAFAALMYLIRNIDTRTNPIPYDYKRPEADYFFSERKETKRDKLKKMLNVR